MNICVQNCVIFKVTFSKSHSCKYFWDLSILIQFLQYYLTTVLFLCLIKWLFHKDLNFIFLFLCVVVILLAFGLPLSYYGV